jgi:cyanophycin synthetase
VPGRTNVFDKLPFKVILDYGHNPAAVQAMADLALRLEVSGRRVCVLAAPGDRRDEDVRAIARIAATAFDVLILRRDDDTRGRGPEEVPRMMEAELLAQGFPKERIHVIPDEVTAIDAGLKTCKRGDLLVAFADKVSRSWKQVIYFKPDGEDAKSVPPASRSHADLARGAPSGAGPVAPLVALADDASIRGAQIIEDERGVRLAREQDD